MLPANATTSAGDWVLPPLFSVTKLGKVRLWVIRFVQADQKLYSRSGELCLKTAIKDPDEISALFDGSLDDMIDALKASDTYSAMGEALDGFRDVETIIVPKQKRTLQQQALLEAQKKYKDKVDKTAATEDLAGLVGGTTEVGFVPQGLTPYFFPDHKDHNAKHLTPEQIRIGVICQIKHDGNHCVTYADESGNVEMMSRQNIIFPFLERQREQCRLLLKHLPDGTHLDGELFHEDGLEELRGIISSSERDERNSAVQYRLFDIYHDDKATLDARVELLAAAYDLYTQEPEYEPDVITLIENHEFRSLEDIREFYDAAIEAGEEGIVIRKLGPTSYYIKGKKSSNAFKVKPVYDDEATIIDVYKKKTGVAMFRLKRPDGIEFNCTSHGTTIQRREFYEKRESLINKTYTYSYAALNKYGVPSHARGVAFRDMQIN